MTREQILKVNGYSPMLWDSGLEDDNMQTRLQQKRMWPPDQPQVGRSQSQEEADGHCPSHFLRVCAYILVCSTILTCHVHC